MRTLKNPYLPFRFYLIILVVLLGECSIRAGCEVATVIVKVLSIFILFGFCLALVVRILDDCLVQLVVEIGVFIVLVLKTSGFIASLLVIFDIIDGSCIFIGVKMGLLAELVI